MTTTFNFGSGPVPAHQHKNGGGWVANTALVDESAYVGLNSWVFGNVRVYDDARISGNVHIYGNAHISGNAQVSDDARISGNAKVSGKARIFGKACISDDTRISGKACVYGNAHIFGNAKVYGNANISRTEIKGFTPKSPIPVIPDLDAKILAAINQEGCSLNMHYWHVCETTHCRAGWAIHLGGEAGYALEKEVGSWLAGALIYQASTGRIPDFFASAEDTLRDLSKGLR